MLTLYGIPNCDTVKKARAWLTGQGVDFVFHDFKKHGVPEALLPGWIAAVGLDTLINRKGATWRALDAAVQARVHDSASAIAVLREHASAIKRPVAVWGDGSITVGFCPQSFARHLPRRDDERASHTAP